MEGPLKISAATKDLSYAKQRYDGVARPLGRSVLCFDALLAAASTLIAMRLWIPSCLFALYFLIVCYVLCCLVFVGVLFCLSSAVPALFEAKEFR